MRRASDRAWSAEFFDILEMAPISRAPLMHALTTEFVAECEQFSKRVLYEQMGIELEGCAPEAWRDEPPLRQIAGGFAGGEKYYHNG